MRALVWHGKEDIRCDTVTDPELEQPRGQKHAMEMTILKLGSTTLLLGTVMATTSMARQPAKPSQGAAQLQQVASFEHQVTGVTVAKDGRIFVNFPRWTEDAPVSVAELTSDGQLRPDGTLYVTSSHIQDMSWFKPETGPRLATQLWRIVPAQGEEATGSTGQHRQP